MDTLVLASGSADVSPLDGTRKTDALPHILVLDKLKDDVAFSRIGVEAGITGLVVLLIENDRVFTLGHIEVGGGARHTEGVGLGAIGNLPAGQGVGVDRDEKVGARTVGDVSALLQGDELVGLTGVDDRHVGTIGFDQLAESQSYAEIDVLFFRKSAHGAGVVPPVPGVDDQLETLGSLGSRHCGKGEEQHSHGHQDSFD